MSRYPSDSLPDLQVNQPVYAEAAEGLMCASRRLPRTPFCDLLRVSACYQLFHATEALVLHTDQDDPASTFRALLDRFRLMLEGLEQVSALPAYSDPGAAEFDSIEHETGTHYGALFTDFSDEKYFEEPAVVLRERLERNEAFELLPLAGRALDAGCGGGRYSFALKRLGFAEVVGVDTSREGISFASRQLERRPAAGVDFRRMDVLDLDFADQTFDFVFSNGVLHHTTDLRKGLAELARVLKDDGLGFLYLIESPGGIHWDVIDTLRAVMEGVSYELARRIFAVLGVPGNRRFYILDHIMVPINIRLTTPELEALLADVGFARFERLRRGCDYDRVEAIFARKPNAGVKYGVGEHRYLLRKE